MLPNVQQLTLHNLHTVARLLGAVRLLVHERQPNFLELGMKIVPEGVSTDTLPRGGEVTLDFRQLALVYQPAAGSAILIPVEGRSQAALLESLLMTIHATELAAIIPHAAGASYTDAMFEALAGFVNRIKPKRGDLSDSAPLHFDADDARAYADALYAVFTGVGALPRPAGRINDAGGDVTEHFDLSFLWFLAEQDEQHPHLNFGFAPFSAGIVYPYLYAYAYPSPSAAPKLPDGARWNTEGWTGVVLPYNAIAGQSDPAATVEAACTAIFRSLRPALG